MAMALVDVVGVVTMGHRLVAAVRAVLVVVALVDDVALGGAFVPVAVVLMVGMSVVEVVDVLAVGDGHMSTSLPVPVVVRVVHVVGCGHALPPV